MDGEGARPDVEETARAQNTPSQSNSPEPTTSSKKSQNGKTRRQQHLAGERSATPSRAPSPSSTAISRPSSPHLRMPRPLLIASIGNPSPYTHTLHSAGHTVLSALRTYLNFPAFQNDRALGNGVSSSAAFEGAECTLWQSTSSMNVSGKGVKTAWQTWSRSLPASSGPGVLVVVHDELEKPFASVTVKRGTGSVKGHNGLKSIMAAMPGQNFVRLGVGIGRPVSRESDDVARHVLRKMNPVEREKMEGIVGEVAARLKEIAEG
ncbi:hypothetical protein LTR28_004827 [Elasticomyces elasticus]|nr:hypothetical protein LTR28_004827 [Elasticomyces elasticus]